MHKRHIAFVLAGLIAVLAVPNPAAADDPAYALQFDGTTDFVRLSATASMLPAGWESQKTVSLWVRPTGIATCTAPGLSSCDAIFGDRPRTWGISRGTIGGADRIWVWNYDGDFDSVAVEYTVGEWMQIVLVHGGGQLKAFKNGTLVGATASGPTQTAAGPVLHIGGIINNASRNWTFEGEIDEVRIWSLAQTDADIAAQVNTALSGSEPGLAAYYQMSNGSGSSVTDNSGHGWTGSLQDGGSGVPANGPIVWVVSGAMGGSGTVNTPPVANPQNLSTSEDTAAPVILTASDVDENPLTFRVTSGPSHGTLSGTAPDLVYTPAANYNGSDSFTFVANDGLIDSAPASVSLTITAINDPPVAAADSAFTDIEAPVTIQVLANDTDVDGPSLTVVDVGVAEHGSVVNNSTSVIYTPAAGFEGTDSFSYTIADGLGGEASAIVTVTVAAGGDSGYALRFDGVSDFVTLGQTIQMFPPGWQTTKTVELWVKPRAGAFCTIPSAASCDAIFGDRPRWWGISRGEMAGADRLAVWNWDGAMNVVYIDYVPEEWVHIALVHGGGVLKAYKNGLLVGSVAAGATQQPTLPGANPVLQLGGVINTTSRNWTFKGDIDEVRIWNSARTAEQINEFLYRGLLGTESDLVAYYRMSDGSGTSLTDDSGHGKTGTLNDGGNGVPADGPIQWVLP